MTTRFAKTGRKLLLALAATMLLSGCDPVESLPGNYQDEVIVNVDDNSKVDVYDNLMGTLYDSTTSNKKDEVLQKFMDIIAEDQFGKYSEIKALVAEDNDANIAAFIEKHAKAYKHDAKVKLNDNEVTEDEFLAAKFGKTAAQIQKERLVNFYKSLDKKINETFYNEITSKSYNDDMGKFYEERLAYAHFGEMYDIDINHTFAAGDGWFEGYITPELDKEDVSSFVHLDSGIYDDYINRHIVRSALKDKLVEEYILENNYSTLGRAYGRKVTYIKLTRDEKFKELPEKLLEAYATNVIDDASKTVDLETIANAWRGFHGLDKDGKIIELDADEKALLAAAGATLSAPTTIAGVCTNLEYYKETQLGQMLDKYAKIDQGNRYASEEAQSALTEFTNSLAYTKEKGLTIKLAALALTDYTTDGWYVKNGGLTELPESLRNRLFNINVSKELDNVDPATYEYKSTDYLRYVNGNYFLTPATSEASDNHNYNIYNDGTFYLIQVEEAVSTSKLNIDGAESYVAKGKGEALFTEEIAHELAETLGTKDSYVNSAYASYIETYSVIYHDQSILDYFKEKYPELFDDED